MKILHICQYFNENMGYQENILPLYQEKMGNEVYIVTSNRENEFFDNDKQRIKEIGTTNYKGITLIRKDIYFENKNKFVIFKNLYRLIEKIRPDYIFHHGLTSPSMFTIIKYKKNNSNVMLVCDLHAMYENTMRSNKSYFYHKVFWRNILQNKIKFINKIFCVCPESIDFAKDVYNIPENILMLLPLGGDILNLNNYNNIRDKYRNKLGIKKGDLLIIHAGKMAPRKKTEVLLNSFKFIDERRIKLILIGDIDKIYYKTLSKYINNDKRITYIGWKNPENLSKYFCAGDILIQPGTASAIFEEAICNGLPIILDKTKIGDYLVSRKNGVVLPKINEKEISEAINYLNKNRGILKKMHKNAIIFAQTELSYKEIAKKSLSFIGDINY